MLVLHQVFLCLVLVLPILSLSSQALAIALPSWSKQAEDSLESRQFQVIAVAGVIADIGTMIVTACSLIVFPILEAIDKKQHAIEEKYTQSMVAQLLREYPDKNVVIFHDKDSQFSGINWVHQHVEISLDTLSMTQGYEVYVFDSGTFTLVGDGGYINWCCGGDFTRDGNTVEFHQRTIPPQPVAPPPATPPIPPTNPTRANPADTDGNYFVNCKKSDGTVSSGMAYYKNLVPGSNIGHRPDDYKDVVHGSFVTWEKPGVVTFNTGVPVHWNIFGNAQDEGVNQSVGTADNTYEHFWVYKDAGEWLYSVDDWSCYSIYWAF